MKKVFEHTDALVALFESEELLMKGVEELKSNDVKIIDIISPYPLDDLEIDIKGRNKRLGIVTVIAGVIGLFASIIAILYIQRQLNIEFGKLSDIPFYTFIPIIFVMVQYPSCFYKENNSSQRLYN